MKGPLTSGVPTSTRCLPPHDLKAERPVHVLITLRADFYSSLLGPCQAHGRMGANQYNVRRASSERLREVIEKPLALAGAKAQSRVWWMPS